ncbi:MAG TPA: NADP-dependent malic enzyme [Candidatus Tyrphobacter sp.]|nr:NADP-dependent malic enzyme [Candidatus Tyrphobacter sp.]
MANKKSIQELALSAHRKLRGKVEIKSKAALKSKNDLNIYYTPGVAAVSSYVAKHKSELGNYTMKNNLVAVVSDGSAVLGLGDIGPEGALPVMEGKSLLFKELAGVNAFPLVLNAHTADEIVATVKAVAPVFGGINLEDISAPKCFEIEERLQCELDIPVMHDDQHGTAIVVLAGLINAFKAAGKNMKKSRFVLIGAGAAGSAVAKILALYGADDILLVDSRGIISRERKDLDKYKRELAEITNKENISGGLEEAMKGADAVIGLSKGGLLKEGHIKMMAAKPIVFAMANPVPEIMPDEARRAGAYVIATGRSDFENQINNVLAFPGIFRGALDNKVKKITPQMKVKAAQRLAALIKRPTAKNIIPNVFDKRVVKAVAGAMK